MIRKYTWGLDLSDTQQGAGGIGGLLAVESRTGNDPVIIGRLLYFHDANGNVSQMVNIDAGGAINAAYEYDPYGNTLVSSGNYAGTNPFRFSTKYFDVETGMYYYGKRYYVPDIGRWTSRDPMEDSDEPNLLLLVLNSPINLVDPDGQIPFPPPRPRPQPRDCGIDIYRTPICFLRSPGHTWLTWDDGTKGNTADLPMNHIHDDRFRCQQTPEFISYKWNTAVSNYGYLMSGLHIETSCSRATCGQIKECLRSFMKEKQNSWSLFFYNCRHFYKDAMANCCLTKAAPPYYDEYKQAYKKFCCDPCSRLRIITPW